MGQNKVTMTVREAGDNARIIDIQGEVSGEAENALTDAYTEASGDSVRAIILNFDGLEYMNSSGIGLLVMSTLGDYVRPSVKGKCPPSRLPC